MAFLHTSITVANIATLKALTEASSIKRVDQLFLVVEDNGNGDRAWYQYKASATTAEDLPKVINPNDSIGRWFAFAGGDGGSTSFAGEIICQDTCTFGGKVFKFYAPQTSLQLQVKIGFDINITSGSDSIQLHRWNQEPNTDLDGREFVAEIPNTGGEVTVTINSTYRWISFFAKNPSNSNNFDGVCFVVDGNTVTLVSF